MTTGRDEDIKAVAWGVAKHFYGEYLDSDQDLTYLILNEDHVNCIKLAEDILSILEARGYIISERAIPL